MTKIIEYKQSSGWVGWSFIPYTRKLLQMSSPFKELNERQLMMFLSLPPYPPSFPLCLKINLKNISFCEDYTKVEYKQICKRTNINFVSNTSDCLTVLCIESYLALPWSVWGGQDSSQLCTSVWFSHLCLHLNMLLMISKNINLMCLVSLC